MQVSYLLACLIVVFDELLGVHVHGARQPVQFGVLVEFVGVERAFFLESPVVAGAQVGEQVGAFEMPHLLAVFEHAFEPVVPTQLPCLDA